MSKPASYSYIFGRYRLTKKEFLDEGYAIHLNSIQFDVLRILVENHGRYFTKENLATAVFKNADADLNNIEQAIRYLRGILHDDSKESRFIMTKRGQGYCFIADVRKVRDEVLDSDHVKTDTDIEGAKDEVITFNRWLYGKGKVIAMTLLISFIAVFVITIALFSRTNDEKSATVFAALAQVSVIIGLFIHFRHQRESLYEVLRKAVECNDLWDTNESKVISKKGFIQHIKCWQWLLLAWLLLYIFLTYIAYNDYNLTKMVAEKNAQGYALSIILTFLNNLNTLVILYCFYILNRYIEEEERRDAIGGLTIIIVIILMLITIMEVFLLAPIQKEDIPGIASLLSGVAGGIAMALYVGRLQSKFLGPPLWLLIFLYSYTAIQPLFTQLEKTTFVTAILIDIALFLKCILYLYVMWLFQSGRLLFYFRKVRLTYQGVEDEFQEFRKSLQ